jgi:hypothetical protein
MYVTCRLEYEKLRFGMSLVSVYVRAPRMGLFIFGIQEFTQQTSASGVYEQPRSKY